MSCLARATISGSVLSLASSSNSSFGLFRSRPGRCRSASCVVAGLQLRDRQRSQACDGCHDTAEFGQSFEPADGRIAGKAVLADIVEQFVAVIRSERDAPVHVTSIPA